MKAHHTSRKLFLQSGIAGPRHGTCRAGLFVHICLHRTFMVCIQSLSLEEQPGILFHCVGFNFPLSIGDGNRLHWKKLTLNTHLLN